MRTQFRAGLLGFALASLLVCVSGQTTPEISTHRVVVFKDGYCLVVKEVTGMTDDEGNIHVDEVPDAAVLGAFWAVPEDGRLLGMTASETTVTERETKERPCRDQAEMLRSNLDARCTVWLANGTEISGTIRSVLGTPTEVRETASPHHAYAQDNRPQVVSSRLVLPRAPQNDAGNSSVEGFSGSTLVLTTQDGDHLVPISAIQRVRIPEAVLGTADVVKTVSQRKRLTFRFAEADRERKMTLFYFRPGIRWIPTYRLQLTPGGAEKKTAKLSLQAEVLNEAEDLADVPLHLVVGVPNFRFRDVVSPLILERQLRRTLQQAAPQVMGQVALRNQAFSNALFTQRHSERVLPHQTGQQGGAVPTNLPAEITAGGSQDLFVYTTAGITLPKGSRAAIPLFDMDVPYRDVYTWDLQVKRHHTDTAPSGSSGGSPLVLSKNEVWHQVELTNTGTVPWTTGAVLAMQDMQPLAQELLTYTSPGGAVRVPITVAVDVRGTFAEQETERQLQALKWDGYHYALISKTGTLRLTNRKELPILCQVTCNLGGKATAATEDGAITLSPFSSQDWEQYRGSQAVNNHSRVSWEFTLPPAGEKALDIEYQYHVRH